MRLVAIFSALGRVAGRARLLPESRPRLRVSITHVLFALSLGVACAGCKRETPPRTANPPAQPPVAVNEVAQIEACSLITKEEVGAVQNTTISDTRSTETSDGSHSITQCYYVASGPDLSVTLAVTQRSKELNGSSARALWEETFGRFEKPDGKGKESSDDKREQDAEELPPPQRVEGVGESAFWAGDHFGGALYVLKKEVFIRISVGGPNTGTAKLERSKALALKAIARL